MEDFVSWVTARKPDWRGVLTPNQYLQAHAEWQTEQIVAEIAKVSDVLEDIAESLLCLRKPVE